MRPIVLGHRGTRLGAPENSLGAFRLALAQGADGVELDVRLCGSGETVVVHDRDLMRVAGVDRDVESLSLAELRRCELGAGERVPTLREVLALVLGAGRIVNVELKSDVSDARALVRAVLDEVARCAQAERERVWFSSFSSSMCSMLCEAQPASLVGLLFEGDAELPSGTRAVHPRHDLVTDVRVAAWHAAGLRVHVWTVNQAQRAGALGAAGVDALITDDVLAILGALA